MIYCCYLIALRKYFIPISINCFAFSDRNNVNINDASNGSAEVEDEVRTSSNEIDGNSSLATRNELNAEPPANILAANANDEDQILNASYDVQSDGLYEDGTFEPDTQELIIPFSSNQEIPLIDTPSSCQGELTGYIN